MRLPARPLLTVLEREAIHQGYEGVNGFVEVVLGMSGQSITQIRQRGTISIEQADRLTIALKLHPILLWPAEYDAWLSEPPEDEDEADIQAREIQAHRERNRRYRAGEKIGRVHLRTACPKAGHTRGRDDYGKCRDCTADRVRSAYRRKVGIPVDAPLTVRGRSRKEVA